jgi:hypothetical protein
VSNSNEGDRDERLGGELRGSVRLWLFARRGRYFYIVERGGAETTGLVLSGLGERDFAVLDRYEEVPRLYTRAKVEAAGASGTVLRCWVYLPAPALLEP